MYLTGITVQAFQATGRKEAGQEKFSIGSKFSVSLDVKRVDLKNMVQVQLGITSLRIENGIISIIGDNKFIDNYWKLDVLRVSKEGEMKKESIEKLKQPDAPVGLFSNPWLTFNSEKDLSVSITDGTYFLDIAFVNER